LLHDLLHECGKATSGRRAEIVAAWPGGMEEGGRKVYVRRQPGIFSAIGDVARPAHEQRYPYGARTGHRLAKDSLLGPQEAVVRREDGKRLAEGLTWSTGPVENLKGSSNGGQAFPYPGG
jgi:hypothetical protein